jgi:SpoVK/Ycf46/Vps4 family AAA+-type ATPase
VQKLLGVLPKQDAVVLIEHVEAWLDEDERVREVLLDYMATARFNRLIVLYTAWTRQADRVKPDSSWNVFLDRQVRLYVIGKMNPESTCSCELADATNTYNYYDLKRLLESGASSMDEFRKFMDDNKPALVKQLEEESGGVSASASFASQYTLGDLAGIDAIIADCRRLLIDPLKNVDFFRERGLEALPRGILLYGPTGCGKTHLALALARESRLPFLIVDAASIRSKYLGESEKRLAAVFSKARSLAPSILIMDHVEGLLGRRRGESDSADRLVTCFLTELDGIESDALSKPVVVLGMTSKREAVDEAVLRAGRIGFHFALRPPKDQKQTEAVIRKLLSRVTHKLDDQFIKHLSSTLISASPADIFGIITEAGYSAVRHGRPFIEESDFSGLSVRRGVKCSFSGGLRQTE